MALRPPIFLLLVPLVMVQVLLEPAALAECPWDTLNICRDPICKGCATNDFFPDPEDCHRFYVCTGDGTYLPEPAQCSNGQVFNLTEHECQEPSEDDLCPPCTGPTHQECVYECPAEGTSLISSSIDCTTYYECSDGTATLTRCDDATPFFDGTTCQTDETLCCRCQPSCDEEGTYLTIDPIDCRKYWFCIGTSPPTTTTEKDPGSGEAGPSFNTGSPKSPPEYFNTCPEGEVFDATAQACSALATCVTACPNAVNGTSCIDPFICLSTGTFAMCSERCVQEYYRCTEVTWPEYKEPDLCFTGTVFNPDSHICVNHGDCPY